MDKIINLISKLVETFHTAIASIKRVIWGIRYTRAIKKADKLAERYRLRYYVLYVGGKLKCVPKQTIKRLILQGRFKSGTKVQDIENIALYTTKIA